MGFQFTIKLANSNRFSLTICLKSPNLKSIHDSEQVENLGIWSVWINLIQFLQQFNQQFTNKMIVGWYVVRSVMNDWKSGYEMRVIVSALKVHVVDKIRITHTTTHSLRPMAMLFKPLCSTDATNYHNHPLFPTQATCSYVIQINCVHIVSPCYTTKWINYPLTDKPKFTSHPHHSPHQYSQHETITIIEERWSEGLWIYGNEFIVYANFVFCCLYVLNCNADDWSMLPLSEERTMIAFCVQNAEADQGSY